MAKRTPIAKRQQPQIIAGGVARHGDKGLLQLEQARTDGWTDIISGARTARDPRQGTRFNLSSEIPYLELERMYRQDALTRNIVDKPIDLITRDPWKVQGDTDGNCWSYLNTRCFMQVLRRAMKWGRLYGGGVVLIGVDDGLDWQEPLNMDRVKTIEFFRAYDRFSITGTLEDWNQDPQNARFGMREWYTIYPRGAVVPTMSFRVHHSRIIQANSITTTDTQQARNYGWDDSVVCTIYDDVRRFITGLDDSSAVLKDFVQSVLQVSNLQQLLTTGQAGSQQWKQRVQMMDLSRHVLNMMVLDKEESYSKSASSIAGVPDLLDRLMSQVCMSANMPATVLFGKSPDGMNATGESDLTLWYDSCACMQRESVIPAAEYVATIAQACKDFMTQKQKVVIDPAKFVTMTAKEEALLRFNIAQADHIYITDGVVSQDEVAVSRFGGESYSTETELAYPRDPTTPPPEPVEPEPTDSSGQGTGAPAAKKVPEAAPPKAT